MKIGTHDSGSYTFDFKVSFWNWKNKWEWLRKAARVFPCLKEKIIRLSKTQRLDLAEQLVIGSTFLDLRVSRCPETGRFYTSHTFCCEPLETALRAIHEFAGTGVWISFSPDFANQESLRGYEKDLLDEIKRLLEPLISNGDIKVFYTPMDDDITAPWLGDRLDNLWFNVRTIEEFTRRFDDTNMEGKGVDCILTPDEDWSHFLQLRNVSLERYARQVNPIAISLIRSKERPLYATFDYLTADMIFQMKKHA